MNLRDKCEKDVAAVTCKECQRRLAFGIDVTEDECPDSVRAVRNYRARIRRWLSRRRKVGGIGP